MLSAIILAAGLSTRMERENKLLLPFKNKTLITTVVESIISSGMEEIIVVTGDRSLEINDILKYLPVTMIYNPDYKKGITTSIQKGVSVAKGNGYMICLADMPFITSEEYSQLKFSFETLQLLNSACICVPQYKNQRGNPVIFSSFYQKKILTHQSMEGCKEIILWNKQSVYPVEINSANILRDIDTPLDYAVI